MAKSFGVIMSCDFGGGSGVCFFYLASSRGFQVVWEMSWRMFLPLVREDACVVF